MQSHHESAGVANSIKSAEYRHLFEANPMVMLIIDPADGLVVDANPAAEAFYGWTRREMQGKSISDINTLSWDELSKTLASAPDSDSRRFLFQHRLASGEIRDVEVFNGKLELGGRKLFYSCVYDITDRKRFEDKLLESEQRFRVLFQEAPDPLFIESMDDAIHEVNDAACRMLGYSRDELIGKKVATLQAPAVRAQRSGVVESELEKGVFETVDMRKDGSLVAVEVRTVPLTLGGRRLALSAVRDISARKELEEELAQFFQLSGDMLCIADLNTVTYKRVNPAFTRTLGYSEEELLRRPFTDLVHPDDLESTIRLTEETLKQGEPVVRFENRYRHKDGGWRWISWVSRPDLSRGLAYAVARDITDQKAIEKERAQLTATLEAKNAELEQVVYVASHDLRSPLVNIDGYGRELGHCIDELRQLISGLPEGKALLKQAAPLMDEDIPEALRFIRISAAKMDTLLAGLLRLSRSGRAVLTITTLNMNALVADVLTSMNFQANQAGADVRVDDLPPCCGDALHVEQVFTNILGNALKYLDPQRPGSVRVFGFVEGGRAVYCVEDNGIGIDPGHQGKVFEIFHRLHPDKGEGEGLGLSIVKRLVGRLGGEVWVEPAQEQGSRFYVALPVED